MASKKVGRPLKKRSTQKKYLMARQKKIPARKAKKPRTLLGRKTRQVPKVKLVKIPKAKVEKSERLQIRPTKLFVSQMLRQMPKVRMAAKARSLVKALLTEVYGNMENELNTLSQQNDLSTISLTEVQNFLKETMDRELANAISAKITPTTTASADAETDAGATDATLDTSNAPDDSTINAAMDVSASAPTTTA